MQCARQIEALMDVLSLAAEHQIFAIIQPDLVCFSCGGQIVPFRVEEETEGKFDLAMNLARALVEGLRQGLHALRYHAYVVAKDAGLVWYLNWEQSYRDLDQPVPSPPARQHGGPLRFEVVIVDEAKAA